MSEVIMRAQNSINSTPSCSFRDEERMEPECMPATLSGVLSHAYEILKSAERCAEGVEAVKGRICDYNGGASVSKLASGGDENASAGLVEDISHMLFRIEGQIKRVGHATAALEEKLG